MKNQKRRGVTPGRDVLHGRCITGGGKKGQKKKNLLAPNGRNGEESKLEPSALHPLGGKLAQAQPQTKKKRWFREHCWWEIGEGAGKRFC